MCDVHVTCEFYYDPLLSDHPPFLLCQHNLCTVRVPSLRTSYVEARLQRRRRARARYILSQYNTDRWLNYHKINSELGKSTERRRAS